MSESPKQPPKPSKTFEEKHPARPDWMCPGCDGKKEGPHRFSCYVGGARAGQLIVPASIDEDGKVTVHLPGKPEPNKE